MKKFLLPAILALIGTGGGVGAALFLSPSSADEPEEHGGETKAAEVGDCAPPSGSPELEGAADAYASPVGPDDSTGQEFVALGNQFVVPVVDGDRVEALVVLSLSLAVPEDSASEVRRTEPKLRDALLRVLFEHANSGHFGPGFTRDESLSILKKGLRDVAHTTSAGLVQDVLITEIARQEA